MSTKHGAHTVHPTPTPGTTTPASDALAWNIGGVVVIAVVVLFLASWVAVIRYLWKRARRPPLPEGGWWRQGR